jgi:hypothetical protein
VTAAQPCPPICSQAVALSAGAPDSFGYSDAAASGRRCLCPATDGGLRRLFTDGTRVGGASMLDIVHPSGYRIML